MPADPAAAPAPRKTSRRNNASAPAADKAAPREAAPSFAAEAASATVPTDRVLQKAREEQPQLIMFGFDLFDMSAPEFCREIRSDDRTRDARARHLLHVGSNRTFKAVSD